MQATPEHDGIQHHPSLQQVVLSLALLVLTVAIMYYGRTFLMPMAFGALLAVLVYPIRKKVVGLGMPRWLGSTAAVSVPLLLMVGLLTVVGRQAATFANDWPQIRERAVLQLNYLERELPSMIAGLTEDSEEEAEAEAKAKAKAKAEARAQEEKPKGLRARLSRLGTRLSDIGNKKGKKPEASREPAPSESEESTAGSEAMQYGVEQLRGMAEVEEEELSGAVKKTASALVSTGLMFVYMAFFLGQGRRIHSFVLRRAAPEDVSEVRELLGEISEMTRQYLLGRILVVAVLAVLYGIGFSIAGLKYAAFVALLAAVLSIIPYIGNIIGGAITLAFALANGADGSVILGVVITGAVGQLIENYILTPFVVGEKVKVNPLTTIVSVIAFTLVWGGVGAVLAIPFSAILRIVFAHIPSLRDYGYLLGNEAVDGEAGEAAE